jgi:cobalt-precorrin-6B (C15)-methyltransferase
MNGTKLAGGPTQDEIMAVSLFKLGLVSTDTVLEIGCGTGKVSAAMAKTVKKVYALDLRPEAVSLAAVTAREARPGTIEFFCTDAMDFLKSDQVFDCAFLGGTKHLEEILPVLAGKVRRTIVINAVLLSTLERAVATLKRLGIFTEVVQVQVSRSHDIAGSIMFKPIDPVYIIVARGAACS